MSKILDLLNKFLALFLGAFILTMPSFFSKMCYSHCIAPKNFALYAGAGVCGLIAAVIIILKRPGPVLKMPRGSFIFLIFIASLSLSLINTQAAGPSIFKFHYYLTAALWFSIFLYSTAENYDNIEFYLKALLLSGIFPAIVIIGEAFSINFFKIWQNLDAAGLTTRQTYVSTFGNPDFAAPFFGVMSALNIRFLLRAENIYVKSSLWLTQFLFAASLFIPLCRSSQIAFAAFILVYFIILKMTAPEKIPAFINIIVSFAAVIFFIQLKDMLAASGETIFSRAAALFFNGETSSKRLYMLDAGWRIIKDNFYFGCGLNTMLLVFPQYAQFIDHSSALYDSVPYYFNPSHLHNEFINIFAESGVFSFIFFLLAVTSAVYFAVTAAFGKNERNAGHGGITACLLIFILIDSCFNVTLNLPHMLFIFVLLSAIAYNSGSINKKNRFTLNFSGWFLRISACILIIIFSLLGAIFGIKYIKSDWYLMQGKIYEVSGDYEKALHFYKASSSLFASRTEPYCFSADILKSKGRFNEAAECLIKASNINLSLPVIYELAQIAIRHMDLNSELRYLYFLTLFYPGFDEPHYLLGLRYMKEKRSNLSAYGMAQKCFERAIKLNPKHISAVMSLAELHYERFEYEKAVIYINKALKISPQLKNALYLRSLIKGFFYDEF